jgi:hypothetical protein
MLKGKQGVCAWLQEARLESIKASVLSLLGFDSRTAKERRAQRPDGTWRTGTKGRDTQAYVSWKELDEAVDKALCDDSFKTCRRFRTKRGEYICHYCEFERRWETWGW